MIQTRHRAGRDPWGGGFQIKRKRFTVHLLFYQFRSCIDRKKETILDIVVYLFIFSWHQALLSRSVNRSWRFAQQSQKRGRHVLHIHVSTRAWTCNIWLGHRPASVFYTDVVWHLHNCLDISKVLVCKGIQEIKWSEENRNRDAVLNRGKTSSIWGQLELQALS